MQRQATVTSDSSTGLGTGTEYQKPPRVRPPKRKRSPPKAPEEEHCHTPWTKLLAGQKKFKSVAERSAMALYSSYHYSSTIRSCLGCILRSSPTNSTYSLRRRRRRRATEYSIVSRRCSRNVFPKARSSLSVVRLLDCVGPTGTRLREIL